MEQTPYEFIRQRIIQAFLDLAQSENEKALDPEYLEGLPNALFHAENYLLAAWKRYCNIEPKKGKPTQ